MNEKETLEELRNVDEEIRKIIVLVLLGLSFFKAQEQIKRKIYHLRGELPYYVDWGRVAIGLWSYVEYARKFATLNEDKNVQVVVDELRSGKKVKNTEILKEVVDNLDQLANFEPYVVINGQKVEIYNAVDNETRHRVKLELLQDELGLSDEEMLDLCGQDLLRLPKNGGAKGEPFKKEHDNSKGDLFYISQHRGCSKRCLPDESKIVSKTLPSIDGSYWTGTKYGNIKIYSLKDMLARTDKYGWHNFILVGFNCKHHLYEFKGMRHTHKEEPEDYKVEQTMRSLERKMRKIYNACEVYRDIDKKRYNYYFKKWIELKNKYISYAKEHKVEPLLWRCK